MVDNRRQGALRDRFSFQKRGTVSDGFGGNAPGGPFVTQFDAMVNLRPRNGGEAVIADRLQGRQPYVVTARWSKRILEVAVSWQLVGARVDDNRVLNVVSVPTDVDGKRQWVEFLAVQGRPS